MNLESIDKFANKEVSLIVEPLLNWESNGKVFNRVGFILIQRDDNHKSVLTHRYYFDMQALKLLAFETIEQGKKPDFSEYKNVGEKSRAISIKLSDKGSVFVSIANGEKGQQKPPYLFINLTVFNFNRLMLACLDYIRHFELARHITGKAYEEREFGQQQQQPDSKWGSQYQGQPAQQQAPQQTPHQAPQQAPQQTPAQPPWEEMDQPPF